MTFNGSSFDLPVLEEYFPEGRIQDIADYCESDVVNTYRVWLRHELFQEKLTEVGFAASEVNLDEFISKRRAAQGLR